MSKSRNIVEEIMEIRARQPDVHILLEPSMRLMYLESVYKKRQSIDEELWRYFPISVVACLEAFFRLAIKQLIDAGEPYLTNSQYLLSKRKIDFDMLKALHGQSITIGDIAGHLISISNLDQISKAMSELLGHNFLKEISQTYDRYAVEVHKELKRTIISDSNLTFRLVKRTFELRHIFCHEFANKYELDTDEIEQCFEHSCGFLKASREHIWQTMFPDEPLTQTAMNIDMANKCNAERQKLDVLIQRVLKRLRGKQTVEFLKANKAWEEFLFASARVEGLQYEGGTIESFVAGKAILALLKERIQNLESLLERVNKP